MTREEYLDFIAEVQPTHAERELILLVSMSPDKVWSDKDLDDERNLRLGFNLLAIEM